MSILPLIELLLAHPLLMLKSALALTFTLRFHVVVAEVQLVTHLWPVFVPNMFSIWVGCFAYLDG